MRMASSAWGHSHLQLFLGNSGPRECWPQRQGHSPEAESTAAAYQQGPGQGLSIPLWHSSTMLWAYGVQGCRTVGLPGCGAAGMWDFLIHRTCSSFLQAGRGFQKEVSQPEMVSLCLPGCWRLEWRSWRSLPTSPCTSFCGWFYF